jgi:2-oxoglutarate ferredoxin oxidoreductase subunit alpha
MIKTRAQKIANIANDIPLLQVSGPEEGDLLVIGWGGTYGSITTAVERAQHKGYKVAQAHLRYLNPFPSDLGDVLKRYDAVMVPEMNLGQLSMLLRARYLVDVVGYNHVRGLPLRAAELADAITDLIGATDPSAEPTVETTQEAVR